MCVLTGLGVSIGVLRTILIYFVTQVAASLGPLPAGVGTTEAALGTLLAASRAPAGTIAAAVIAFRVVDLWLPLVAGGVAGLRRRNPTTSVAASEAIPLAPHAQQPDAAQGMAVGSAE